MEDLRMRARDLLDKARDERDELRAQLHPARAEVCGEWNGLEPRFAELQRNAHNVAGSAGEASEDVGAVVEALLPPRSWPRPLLVGDSGIEPLTPAVKADSALYVLLN